MEESSIGREINGLIAQLAELRGAREEYDPIMKDIAERESAVRAELQEKLGVLGSKASVRDYGLTVTLAERRTKSLVDVGKAKAFLEERGVLEAFTTIDAGRAIEMFGDDLPGVMVQVSSYLSVRSSGTSA